MEGLNTVVIIATIVANALLSTCTERLIIDVDGGPDDAMAILLVLSAHKNGDSKFRTVGITCTYGNTFESYVEDNIRATLKVADVDEIPIFAGAKKPLTKEYNPGDWFGPDGFGGFLVHDEPLVHEPNEAAMKMVNEARRFRGELNILALGPLTNIAHAILLDRNFMRNVKKIYVMGGSLTGRADYNFHLDPRSDTIVLESTPKPIILFTRDANTASPISLRWRSKYLGGSKSAFMTFLNAAEEVALKKVAKSNSELREKDRNAKLWPWGPSDVKAAAAMIWPNLIKKKTKYHVSIIPDGQQKGMLFINNEAKRPNVEIIEDFDTEGFKEKLLKYFT